VPNGKPAVVLLLGRLRRVRRRGHVAVPGGRRRRRQGRLPGRDNDPGESTQTVRDFPDFIKAPKLPAVIDTGAVLTHRFHVAALSTLIVVDTAGTVTYRATDPTAAQIQAEQAKAGAR
jgi:hypothetical protein